MNKSDTLLVELGTEELPPKALKPLSDAFTNALVNGLIESQLIDNADQAQAYATPRRLALSVPNTISTQPDQVIERRGPAIQAAFKKDGTPTPAAMGFAKSCGVEVADLSRFKTDKGEWLSYSINETGKTIGELLPGIIDQAIKRLPIPKRMRWGDSHAEFVRPVKWLVVMHGDEVLPTTVLDVVSNNTTLGHRFHSDGELIIKHADDYKMQLLDQGNVLADFSERQTLISQQVSELVKQVGGQTVSDPFLLDEVTGLVEYPTALLGRFDEDFLAVPQECLISSMRDHQKYFHVVNEQGRLLPYFITVSNIKSTDPKRVQEGNERVLRARLSDAQFFWETDQKTRLEERVDKLGSVLFHVKLGSVLDKAKRIQMLSGKLATVMNGNVSIAERGALLAKADLVSDMVSEFDELQGIMGHYYADRDGENSLVGECVEQHYWPKFAGDQLPVSIEAQAVALADKLDSLVGIYGAGETPTGDKDPYALRRAALSILRILIEQQHNLNLSDLVNMSREVYATQQEFHISDEAQHNIVDFIRDRLIAFYQSQDISTNTINAVMSRKPDSPLDFEQRVKAVHAFSKLSEANDLAAANKRIANILKKQVNGQHYTVNSDLLYEAAEQTLYKAISAIEKDCLKLFDHGDYAGGLQKLASLRTPVDDFFEHVMVMSDNQDEQTNRLALLQQMQALFLRVADISLLQA